MSSRPLLLVASGADADMLYATGLQVPDPFVCLKAGESVLAVLPALERDRAEDRGLEIRSLEEAKERLGKEGVERPGLGEVAGLLLRELGIGSVQVPESFPFGIACALRRSLPGLDLVPAVPFPGRAVKSGREIRHLQRILERAEEGLRAGLELLGRARIDSRGGLRYRDAPLTSERVRGAIDACLASQGAIPGGTIVAGGDQACSPHEAGSGPLQANLPIVIDVFPRCASSGYHGDITRTVVRGRASEAARSQFHSVREAQEKAVGAAVPGARGDRIHELVRDCFVRNGHQTGDRGGRMQGFFHGTGHGLGLELHEAPRLGAGSADVLEAGNVVTVEPGLYYPGVGGVRIEDVALVGQEGPRRLTSLETRLEL